MNLQKKNTSGIWTFMLTALVILSGIFGVMAGCGKKVEPVAFDVLESSRVKAKDNAEWNAQKYRTTLPDANWSIEANTDSSMVAECPQGDGWASVKIINIADPKQKVSLKCSTVSSAVGCLPDAEFKGKTYGSDDGKCQPTSKVPFPIPTLQK